MLAAGFAATACTPEPEDYATKIAAARAAKDEGFKSDPGFAGAGGQESRAACRSRISRLMKRTRCRPRCEPAGERTRIQVPTSTGKIRDIERVGTLKFSLKGQPLKLTAFMEVDDPRATGCSCRFRI